MNRLEAQRTTNRQAVLEHIRAAANGLNANELAALTGLSQRGVITLCIELSEGRLVKSARSSDPKRRGGGLVWHALNPAAYVASRTAFPFRPLRTQRPSIVPVRCGGRLAPDIGTDARLSFGAFTPNPYHPIKEDFAW